MTAMAFTNMPEKVYQPYKVLNQCASILMSQSHEAVELVMERAKRSGSDNLPKPDQIREALQKRLMKAKLDQPTIKLVFKDVTYEQTKSQDFRDRLERALPAAKRKKLGHWAEHFDAAKEVIQGGR